MVEIEKQEEGVRTRAFYKAYGIKPEMNLPCPGLIDTSGFAKICSDSMEQVRGQPFTPTRVRLGEYYGEKKSD